MIKNIKNAFKLIPYSLGWKRNIVVGIIIFVIGVVIEVVTAGTNALGGFYIALAGVLPGQMIFNLCVPSVTITSPRYRELMIKYHRDLSVAIEMVSFTLVVIFHSVLAALNPERKDAILGMLIIVAVTMFVSHIFMSTMVKKYWVSFILLLVTIMVLSAFNGNLIYGEETLGWNPIIYYVGSYLLIILGALADSAIGTFFYKYDLDPMVYKSMLKKLGD